MDFKSKRLAAINDLAGFGRCSLSVMMPVISACGNQCCPVPTAILSSTDGISGFSMKDLTDDLSVYLRQWKQLKLSFDGIYTGYLSSARQVETALSFLQDFSRPDTCILVDPVLGDQGIVGSNCTDQLIKEYHSLIARADFITPNLTEAFFLCGLPYQEYPDERTLDLMGEMLLSKGPKAVIITGIKHETSIDTYLFERDQKNRISSPRCPQERIGTGDLFSSIFLSSVLQGDSFVASAKKASDFIAKALFFSEEQNIPVEEGICFEPFLGQLSPYFTQRSEMI